jgi:hypothetical protein
MRAIQTQVHRRRIGLDLFLLGGDDAGHDLFPFLEEQSTTSAQSQ